jgi:hypothetical protein
MTTTSTLIGTRTLKSLAAPTLAIWRDELEHAKLIDRECGTAHVSRQTRMIHRRRGLEMVVIFRNSRDQWGMLCQDSGQVLMSGATRDAVVAFAARWHSEKPTHREVAIFRDDALSLQPIRRRVAEPLRRVAEPVREPELAIA